MAEFMPCPLLRLPCLYEPDNKQKPSWLDVIVPCSEFETTRKLRLRDKPLGMCRIFLSLFFITGYLYREFILEKSYLEKAHTNGFARLSIQHPVMDGCNPLHLGCRANFTRPEHLPYCQATLANGLQTGVGEHSVGCIYLDEYEIFKFDSGTDSSNFLIPTRISRIEQVLNHSCVDVGCDEPYTIIGETHDFVADIENYTMLLDHSFLCEELGKSGDTYQNVGFVRDCTEIHEGGEESVVSHLISFGEEECPVLMIPGAPPGLDLEAIGEGYDSEGEVHAIHSYEIGDIMKVSELMRLARIDLDDVQGDESQHGSVRYEGEVIIMEIHYLNYREGHFPNSLPPIYEYHVYRLPTETYKMTFVPPATQAGVLSPHRTVHDVHGIHVEVRIMGKIGKHSTTKTMMILLEMIALLGLFTWLLTCVAFNMTRGKEGDDFYDKVHREIDIQHLHAEGDIFNTTIRNLDGYSRGHR